MHIEHRRPNRVRALHVAVVAILAMAAAACAPATGGSSPDYFAGGTYEVDITVPSQTFSETFALFDSTCTASATTPSLSIPDASLTLSPAQVDPGTLSVVIPGATLDLPRATLSAGSISVSCNGSPVFQVEVAVQFDGAISVQSASLDLSTHTATLADPTITITNASASVVGLPGIAPIALDPITLTVPSVNVPVG